MLGGVQEGCRTWDWGFSERSELCSKEGLGQGENKMLPNVLMKQETLNS